LNKQAGLKAAPACVGNAKCVFEETATPACVGSTECVLETAILACIGNAECALDTATPGCNSERVLGFEGITLTPEFDGMKPGSCGTVLVPAQGTRLGNTSEGTSASAGIYNTNMTRHDGFA